MRLVWNRQKKKKETVIEYRGKLRRFLYTHPVGKLITRYILSIPVINNLITRKKYRKASQSEVIQFIDEFSINTDEFIKKPEEFECFADFFIRKLKPGSRPVDPDPFSLIAPADGELLITDITADGSFFVKEIRFCLASFLRNRGLAAGFSEGMAAILYLTPRDCHWFSYPLDCRIISSERLGTKLFPTNELATEYGFRFFDVNIRDIHVLETFHRKRFIMAEVGAFYAGKIHQVENLNPERKKGEEKGYFGLGGSTIVLIFKKEHIVFDSDLLKLSKQKIPVRVKQGERIGRILK